MVNEISVKHYSFWCFLKRTFRSSIRDVSFNKTRFFGCFLVLLLEAHEVETWADLPEEEPYLWKKSVISFCRSRKKRRIEKITFGFQGMQSRREPLIRRLESHLSGINAVSFAPDRNYLVSTSDDNTLKVWDPETGTEVDTLRGHLREVL